MTEFFVASIVEGHGEVQAVPILLRRILHETRGDASVKVSPPIRVKSGSFLHDSDYFSRHMELVARKARSHPKGIVFILLDLEDGCPAETGPDLTSKAAVHCSDLPTVVVLAYREFETWFLASACSLQGRCGLPLDLEAPANPEAIRNAKGWLGQRMQRGYNETNDQPALTAGFSFHEAATVPSFSRCRSKLQAVFAP